MGPNHNDGNGKFTKSLVKNQDKELELAGELLSCPNGKGCNPDYDVYDEVIIFKSTKEMEKYDSELRKLGIRDQYKLTSQEIEDKKISNQKATIETIQYFYEPFFGNVFGGTLSSLGKESEPLADFAKSKIRYYEKSNGKIINGQTDLQKMVSLNIITEEEAEAIKVSNKFIGQQNANGELVNGTLGPIVNSVSIGVVANETYKVGEINATSIKSINTNAAIEDSVTSGKATLKGNAVAVPKTIAENSVTSGKATLKGNAVTVPKTIAEDPVILKEGTSTSKQTTNSSERPSWRQSETDLHDQLWQENENTGNNVGGNNKVSYKDGEVVSSGTKGSTRPDNTVYDSEGNLLQTVEIKNYDLNRSGGESQLINNVVNQAIAREAQLPNENITQRVVIDIRGQSVGELQQQRIRTSIETKASTSGIKVEVEYMQ